jgi:hypothetical protein
MYLKFPRNSTQGGGIEIRSGEYFIELCLLLFQRVGNCSELLLEEKILEVALLLNFMDCLDKFGVKIVTLLLNLDRTLVI